MERYRALDIKLQNAVTIILLFMFNMICLNIYTAQNSLKLLLSSILGAFLTISAIRHLFLRNTKLWFLLPPVEGFLLLAAFLVDNTNRAPILLIVYVGDLIACYEPKFSTALSIAEYVLWMVIFLIKNQIGDMDTLVTTIMQYASLFAFLLLVMTFLRRQVLQGQHLKDLMGELKARSLELEELAVVKERNRIAGELHDTLGHTLTGALVEMEGAKILVEKDPVKAREKITSSREQVKKALQQLRESVRTIRDGGALQELIPSIRSLLKEMERNLNIKIESRLDTIETIDPIQQKVILLALQEAVTNGLKHGAADHFEVELSREGGMVNMVIRDNGKGAEPLIFGFGLSTMRERFQSLGGNITALSSPNDGFTLAMKLPIGQNASISE